MKKFTEYAENLGIVKPHRVACSSSHVEQAMRKVTDPRGLNESFRESDARELKKTNGMINQERAEKLEKGGITYKLSWDSKYAYVIDENTIYKVYSWADKYKVLKHNNNNVLDKEFNEFESINEVIDYIKGVQK